MPSPPVGVAATPGAGASTGTCGAANDSPPLKGGTDGAGVVASGGAGGSAADPGCSIACIAPSENDCRRGSGGLPGRQSARERLPHRSRRKALPEGSRRKRCTGRRRDRRCCGSATPGTDGARPLAARLAVPSEQLPRTRDLVAEPPGSLRRRRPPTSAGARSLRPQPEAPERTGVRVGTAGLAAARGTARDHPAGRAAAGPSNSGRPW